MTLPQQRMKSQPLRRFLFQRWFIKNSRRSLGPEVGFWVNLVILSEIMDQFLSRPPTSRYLFTWVKMHAGEESVRRTCRANAPWGEITRWGRQCGAWARKVSCFLFRSTYSRSWESPYHEGMVSIWAGICLEFMSKGPRRVEDIVIPLSSVMIYVWLF